MEDQVGIDSQHRRTSACRQLSTAVFTRMPGSCRATVIVQTAEGLLSSSGRKPYFLSSGRLGAQEADTQTRTPL